MALFPTLNGTSDPDEQECSFLDGFVWRKSYLTDGTRRNLVALTSVLSTAILPTILLNALVVIAVAKRHRLRTPSNILLASMAGTDLFTGLIVQPIGVAKHTKRMLGHGPFCFLEAVYMQLILASALSSFSHLAGTDLFTGLIVQPIAVAVHLKRILSDSTFCNLEIVYIQLWSASGITSFSHLVLIGIDRFIAVKKPLRYQNIVTRQRVKIGVILAWAFTFILRIPELTLFTISSKQQVYFYSDIQGVILSILSSLTLLL